ncbi:MAG: metallophosphoesterase, partial [Proteobacteria bacterium]|nr:metallophosphoesterase [Pseudomonadota bacterium]
MSQEKEIALFLSIAIGIWTILNLYVLWRLASVPLLAHHLPRGWLISAVVFLWASFVLGHFLDHLGLARPALPLELIGSNWLGILFYLFCCFILVDIITVFGFLLPRFAPALRGFALLGAGMLCLIAFIQGIRTPVVRDYEVRLSGLPAEADGTVIAAISDLHLGTLTSEAWLKARISQIEALQPGLVVILGDLVEGHGDLEQEKRMIPLLQTLKAPLGVYAVTGNHEHYAAVGAGPNFFQEAGIRLLRDEWIEARPGLVLAGVDDPVDHRLAAQDNGRFQRALTGRPKEAAVVFLSHRPQGTEFLAGAGVGL